MSLGPGVTRPRKNTASRLLHTDDSDHEHEPDSIHDTSLGLGSGVGGAALAGPSAASAAGMGHSGFKAPAPASSQRRSSHSSSSLDGGAAIAVAVAVAAPPRRVVIHSADGDDDMEDPSFGFRFDSHPSALGHEAPRGRCHRCLTRCCGPCMRCEWDRFCSHCYFLAACCAFMLLSSAARIFALLDFIISIVLYHALMHPDRSFSSIFTLMDDDLHDYSFRTSGVDLLLMSLCRFVILFFTYAYRFQLNLNAAAAAMGVMTVSTVYCIAKLASADAADIRGFAGYSLGISILEWLIYLVVRRRRVINNNAGAPAALAAASGLPAGAADMPGGFSSAIGVANPRYPSVAAGFGPDRSTFLPSVFGVGGGFSLAAPAVAPVPGAMGADMTLPGTVGLVGSNSAASLAVPQKTTGALFIEDPRTAGAPATGGHSAVAIRGGAPGGVTPFTLATSPTTATAVPQPSAPLTVAPRPSPTATAAMTAATATTTDRSAVRDSVRAAFAAGASTGAASSGKPGSFAAGPPLSVPSSAAGAGAGSMRRVSSVGGRVGSYSSAPHAIQARYHTLSRATGAGSAGIGAAGTSGRATPFCGAASTSPAPGADAAAAAAAAAVAAAAASAAAANAESAPLTGTSAGPTYSATAGDAAGLSPRAAAAAAAAATAAAHSAHVGGLSPTSATAAARVSSVVGTYVLPQSEVVSFPVPGLRPPSALAVPPEHAALAGPDSRFVLFEGVLLHYTVYVRSDAARYIAAARASAGVSPSAAATAVAATAKGGQHGGAAGTGSETTTTFSTAAATAAAAATTPSSSSSSLSPMQLTAPPSMAPPPALVLHHGFGSSLFAFLPTVGALMTPTVSPLGGGEASYADTAAATAAVAAGRAALSPGASAVLCFDRPGFGLSGRPQEAELAARERARGTRLREQGALERERSRLSALYGHSLRANAATRALLASAHAPEPSPYHVDFAARATFALMQAHGLDLLGAVVGGHHSGAAVVVRTVLADADAARELEQASSAAAAASAAASRPALAMPAVQRLVRGAVLIAPSLYDDGFPSVVRSLFRTTLGRTMVQQLLRSEMGDVALRRAWHRPSAIPPAVLAQHRAFSSLPHWHEAYTAMATLPSPNEALVARLRELQCPVLLIHGEQDKIVGAGASGQVACALSHSSSVELVHVPLCGHCPHEEQAEVFIACTAAFIRAVVLQSISH